MKVSSIAKRLLAYIFVLIMFFSVMVNHTMSFVNGITEQFSKIPLPVDSDDSKDHKTYETEYCESLWQREKLINLNGATAKLLKMRGYFGEFGLYVTPDEYVVVPSPLTSTDYEYNELLSFYDFLNQNGINLLYVNEPTKYTDDTLFQKQFGVASYSNTNADKLVARIRDAGINTIDLREVIKEQETNAKDLFYRTDHHWTTKAGLWAASVMAKGLNDSFDYCIDESLFYPNHYSFNEWKQCWLGEQGRKLGVSYIGLDDYTEIKPTFSTKYLFKTSDGYEEGSFEHFINESLYNTENNVYDTISWHYSYRRLDSINQNIDKGSILMLGDSYENVVLPFLSLGVHKLDILVLRDCNPDFDLRQYILDNGYDTVIVAYAQFMIGAHDDPDSPNYRMYSFH